MSFQSIVPPEALEAVSQLPQPEYCRCRYGQLAGHRDSRGNFVVERIISTDPAAFLDASLAPGSVVQAK